MYASEMEIYNPPNSDLIYLMEDLTAAIHIRGGGVIHLNGNLK